MSDYKRDGGGISIYISGPITGIKDRNKKEFEKAAKDIKAELRKKYFNFKIINPVKLGLKLDKKMSPVIPEWEDYMRMCIKELSTANFIFMLPGWGNSEGAILEKYIAKRLKILCFENINELKNHFSGGKQ